jgi:ribosomal protein S24E
MLKHAIISRSEIKEFLEQNIEIQHIVGHKWYATHYGYYKFSHYLVIYRDNEEYASQIWDHPVQEINQCQ